MGTIMKKANQTEAALGVVLIDRERLNDIYPAESYDSTRKNSPQEITESAAEPPPSHNTHSRVQVPPHASVIDETSETSSLAAKGVTLGSIFARLRGRKHQKRSNAVAQKAESVE